MNLATEEFYGLTPRQLQHLLRRHREQRQHAELLAGIISSTIANCTPMDRKEPFSPSDFMPARRRKAPASDGPTREQRQRIAFKTRSFFDLAVTEQQKKNRNTEVILGKKL